MGCKEVMVVAPLIITLYEFTFYSVPLRELVKKRAPLYLSLFSTWVVLAAILMTNPRGKTVGFGLGVSMLDYFLVQCWALTLYLKLAFLPVGLSADYGEFAKIPIHVSLPSFLLISFVAGITVWLWTRNRIIAFLLSTFFIILSPTSSFVPITTEPIAERRMYLPLFSVATLFCLAIYQLLYLINQRHLSSTDRSITRTATQCNFFFGLIILLLAGATFVRNEVFQDITYFWEDVTLKTPENARGQHNYGIRLVEVRNYDLAKKSLRRAVVLNPRYQAAWLKLSYVESRLGKNNEAIEAFKKGLSLNPEEALSSEGYAAWIRLGKLYVSQKNFKEARLCFERAKSGAMSNGETQDDAIKELSDLDNMEQTMKASAF